MRHGGDAFGELDEFGIVEKQGAIVAILELGGADLLRIESQQQASARGGLVILRVDGGCAG